jgi:hypothetical protein
MQMPPRFLHAAGEGTWPPPNGVDRKVYWHQPAQILSGLAFGLARRTILFAHKVAAMGTGLNE